LTNVDDKEPFLSRWSRRKLGATEDAPAAVPAAEPAAAAPAVPPAPAAESTAPATAKDRGSEYRAFFDPEVDEKLRRTALKKLFSEPQFNVMDGLDTYIDDYSIADPIPDAMLRQLNQAKALFLFDDEETTDEGAAKKASAAHAGAAAAPPEEAADTTTPPNPAAAGAPAQGKAATGAAAEPLAQGAQKN
jgi:hypothetical protein